MGNPGSVRAGFRGDGPWRGMTTQSLATPGMFELLENCYVSSDGSEIRPMPGFKTYGDFSLAHNNTTGAGGLNGLVTDARRPVSAVTGNYRFNTAATQSLAVWSEPTHIHGFEQVSGRFILFGEDDFRREPIRNSGDTAYIVITDYTFNAAGTILTFNQNYRTGANTFNAVDTTIGAGNSRLTFRIWITGLTGPGAVFLNNIVHTIDTTAGSFPAANQFRILTSIVGPGNNGTGQSGSCDWITQDFTSSNTVSDDNESLTTWTIDTNITPGLPTSLPVTVAYRAYVANRQRDFGDATTTIVEGGDVGCSRRRQLSIPYRLVPHVSGNRLIMVAPGYNCVFQAPVVIPINFENGSTDGLQWIANDLYDRPRCLGVPKAVQWQDYTGGSTNSYANGSGNTWTAAAAGNAFGGTNAAVVARQGKYTFAVRYRDEATGEVGLISEPVSVTTGGTDPFEGVRLLVMFPGYLMHECLALTIDVFRTTKDGAVGDNNAGLFFDRSFTMEAFFASSRAGASLGLFSAKYGVQPSAAANEYRHYVELRLPYTTDEILKKNLTAPDPLTNMPMGAKAGRTIRGGWTVFGGALGNNGKRLELWKSQVALYYGTAAPLGAGGDPLYPYPNQIFSRIAENTSASPPGLNSGHPQWGCGVHGIPPAYEGQEIFSRSLFPYPRETVRINKLVNPVTDFNPPATVPQSQLRELRYEIERSPIFADLDVSRDPQDAFLKLPRAQLQMSEADNPGVTPATNTIIVSHETGEDVEAIGEANGDLVVCTRGKTYIIGYAESPKNGVPQLATDQFGCIGANTMVQFDFGCAWISDRGPCAVMGGSFRWIGEDLQHFFCGETARYKRDTTGMMRHSWACHDPDRGLIFFGLFADRGVGTANEASIVYRGNSTKWTQGSFFKDEQYSRFPCDEILIYSYKADAWSVWRPPLNLLVKWMARGVDIEGQPRTFFLGSDNRIYQLDDAFAMWNAQPIQSTVQSASTGTVIATNGAFGTDTTARGNGTFWVAGMDVLVVKGIDGRPLIKRTTLVSISGGNVTVADSVTVESGDIVIIGSRAMTLKTTFVSPKLYETAREGKVAIRYAIDGAVGATSYAQGAVLTTKMEDSEPEGDRQHLNDEGTGFDHYAFLGERDDESDSAHVVRCMDHEFSLGSAQGTNARLELTVVGGASLRLQDLYTEAQ